MKYGLWISITLWMIVIGAFASLTMKHLEKFDDKCVHASQNLIRVESLTRLDAIQIFLIRERISKYGQAIESKQNRTDKLRQQIDDNKEINSAQTSADTADLELHDIDRELKENLKANEKFYDESSAHYSQAMKDYDKSQSVLNELNILCEEVEPFRWAIMLADWFMGLVVAALTFLVGLTIGNQQAITVKRDGMVAPKDDANKE